MAWRNKILSRIFNSLPFPTMIECRYARWRSYGLRPLSCAVRRRSSTGPARSCDNTRKCHPPDTYCEYSICRLLTACETVHQPQFWCRNSVSDAGFCGFSLVVAWAPAFPVLPVLVGAWAVFWFCWHCDYGRYNSDTCSSRSTLSVPFRGVQMFF